MAWRCNLHCDLGGLPLFRVEEGGPALTAQVFASEGALKQIAYAYASVAASVTRYFSLLADRPRVFVFVPSEILGLQFANARKLIEADGRPDASEEDEENLPGRQRENENADARNEKGQANVFGKVSFHGPNSRSAFGA